VRAETAYIDGELCGVDDAGLPSFANTQAATDGKRGAKLGYYGNRQMSLSAVIAVARRPPSGGAKASWATASAHWGSGTFAFARPRLIDMSFEPDPSGAAFSRSRWNDGYAQIAVIADRAVNESNRPREER
jgi:hypothetical protein